MAAGACYKYSHGGYESVLNTSVRKIEICVIVKRGVEVTEHRVTHVFLAENGLAGVDEPVDAERCVKDRDAAVGLRSVVVVTFILEDGDVGEHGETVGETAGHEKLTVIVFRQLDRHVAAIGRGAFADVNGHVKHTAFDAAHKL